MIAAAARDMNEVLHLAAPPKHAALGVADLECALSRAEIRVAAPFPAAAVSIEEVVMRIGGLAAQNDSFAAAAGAKLPPSLRRESAARAHPGGRNGDLIGRSVADGQIRLRGRRKSAGCGGERDRKTRSIHFTLQKMSFEKLAISHRRPPKQLTRSSRRRSTVSLRAPGKRPA